MASADHPGLLERAGHRGARTSAPRARRPTTPSADAIHMLRDEGKPVIVVDDGRPLGILTALDLIEALNR